MPNVKGYCLCKKIDKRFIYYLQFKDGQYYWNGLIDNAYIVTIDEARDFMLRHKIKEESDSLFIKEIRG